MRLYYHKTDGGAEYLCSNNVEGTNEGSFNSHYIVRIDGDIREDTELIVKKEYDKVCEVCNEVDEVFNNTGICQNIPR